MNALLLRGRKSKQEYRMMGEEKEEKSQKDAYQQNKELELSRSESEEDQSLPEQEETMVEETKNDKNDEQGGIRFQTPMWMRQWARESMYKKQGQRQS